MIIVFIYFLGWAAGGMTVYFYMRQKALVEASKKRVRPEDLRPPRY